MPAALTAVNPLDIRTAISVIQQALVDCIDLAYRYRYPAVATAADLRTEASIQLPDRALRYCTEEGTVYRLLYSSRLAEQLPYVVKPDDRDDVTAGGRWIRQSSGVTLGPDYRRIVSRVQYGYARAVQAYQGESEDQLTTIYAQRPAFLVEYIGDDLELKGYAPGTIYRQDFEFKIHCLSQNLRPELEALFGSPYEGEQDASPGSRDPRTVDPGLYRMMGDIRYFLAGNDLGLAPGVKTADIQGRGTITEQDLQQRIFTAEVSVKVWASVHVVDEDLLTPIELWVQRQDANAIANGGTLDPANYVAEGLGVTPCDGLNAAPAAGVAYVRGALVICTPGVYPFPASMDTYRDLVPSGQLVYQSVEVGAEPPDVTANGLRIGLTRTDDQNVVADVILCSYAVNSGADPGDPFKVGSS